MKAVIIAYLTVTTAASALLASASSIWSMPAWWQGHTQAIACTAMGLLGGSLYCLRGVYLNSCVHDRWNSKWYIWYFLRPATSTISGLASYIFLKAGLLVLDATTKSDSTPYGYLAIAFIAGYNVDNFLKKLEDIASSVWGINKSRSAEDQTAETGTVKRPDPLDKR
jgi:hypothetical protein